MMDGHRMHFERKEACKEMENEEWAGMQARMGNLYFDAVKEDWWYPPRNQQLTLNQIVPLFDELKNQKIDLEIQLEKQNVEHKNQLTACCQSVSEIKKVLEDVGVLREKELENYKKELENEKSSHKKELENQKSNYEKELGDYKNEMKDKTSNYEKQPLKHEKELEKQALKYEKELEKQEIQILYLKREKEKFQSQYDNLLIRYHTHLDHYSTLSFQTPPTLL